MNKNVRNALILVLGIIFIAGVAIFMTQSESIPANARVSVVQPQAGLLLPLEGKWIAESNGTTFSASVIDKTIEIDLSSTEGTSMTYWSGSFDPIGHTIVSTVDAGKAVLSQDQTKVFTIGEDSLSFPFQMLGMKKIVELHRV